MTRDMVTHACCLDVIGDLREELFVLFGILASNEDMERDLSTLQRIQMLGYILSIPYLCARNVGIVSVPFFEVVTM